ncbi:MAG: response regulator, partial [Candidatus Hydrogenedentes bacterium]|nr:response regulator [Candidatus Hydrogenedentota bacterium]
AGHYTVAALITVVLLPGITLIMPFLIPGPFQFWIVYYLIVPVLIAGVFLPYRVVFLVIAANLAGILLIPDIRPDVELYDMPALFFFVATAMIVGVRWHNEALESIRREELAKSRSRYKRLLETSFGAIVVLERGRVVEANPGFFSMFEYGPEDIGTLRFQDLAPPAAGNVPFDGALTECELSGSRKDGTAIDIECLFRPLEDSPDAYMVAIRDVTDRKRIEEQQHDLEEQLERAQRMETVGRLTGGIAHDFNNLLTPIIGYAQLALETADPESLLRRNLEHINDAALRAANLTRQLLAFSRSQVLEMRNVDLNEVLHGLGGMLRRLIGEDIEIDMHLGGDIGTIRADPTQLTQLVLNLAVNARDAMPHGGTLVIETASADIDETYAALDPRMTPGAYTVLVVSDTGVGIEAEHVDHIFDPFFTTKPVGKGTGLGLATVHGIVKQHGGDILVYSLPGEGTTFRIYFPRSDKQPESLTGPEREAPGPHGTETILLVEDSPQVRGLVLTVLEKYGYTVIEAATPEHAIEIAGQNGEIDLLLTDIIMPQMDGLELRGRLRRAGSTMKALFMSGYTADLLDRHGVSSTDLKYLPKPFSVRELTSKVREALDG